MVAVQSFFAVISAFFILNGSAAPYPFEKRVNPFTIHQILRNKPHHKKGPTTYLKSLTKFNGSVEQIATVSQSVQDAQPGSVAADSAEGDTEFTTPITIGSQNFNVDIDTGSSDLWVLGTELSHRGNPSHTFYSPGSTATIEHGDTWSIAYGDGSGAYGIVYDDTVTIGSTTVTNQAVEVAIGASYEYYSAGEPEDGVFGLGFDCINTVTPTQATTFLTNAINQGLPLALFTAQLRHNAAGSFTFGESPSSVYDGSITYTSVDTSNGWWSFTPTGYAISSSSSDDSTVQITSSSALSGIADTGTTLLILDESIVNAYYNQVSGAFVQEGQWNFPCDAALPDLIIEIENGAYRAVVPGEYINFATNDGDGSTCYGGIQPTTPGLGMNIYGDIFLKSIGIVVFDRTGYSTSGSGGGGSGIGGCGGSGAKIGFGGAVS